MGKFDNIKGQSLLPGTGRFDNVSAPTKGRFDNIVPTNTKKESFFDKGKNALGGLVGKIGQVLSAGQYAQVAATEKGLEKVGVLKNSGESLVDKFKQQKSNIQLLQKIGAETGKGGVLTGQYTPTTSVFGNFVKEVPSTGIGLAADIFLDPTMYLGKLGIIKKGTGALGKEISTVAKSLAEDRPAIQKMGEMLGRAFIVRSGQRVEFQGLDMARKITEQQIPEEVSKIVSPIIERPAVIQQRIKQVIEGGITTKDEIKTLATPIREELDRVGESISKINPALLSEETFQTNKGTYFPRLYTSHEFVKDEEQLINNVFAKRTAVSVPKDRFKARMEDWEFAKQISPTIVDTETKIQKINNGIFKLVKGKSGEIKKLQSEINKLEIKKINPTIKESLQTISDLVAAKGGITNTEIENVVRGFLLFPSEDLAKIEKIIGKKDIKVGKLIEEIKTIKETGYSKISKLPSLGEIQQLAQKVRAGMGEIKEAGYPAAKGLTQLKVAEVRQKFFQDISKLASEEAKPGWIQMSNSKSLGDLSGKFLPAAEYRAISTLKRVPTQFEEIYSKALTQWKTFKTAYNPATIARNDITNMFVLNPLGGVPIWRQDIYAGAVNDLITKSHIYQMARKEGLEIGTQSMAELTNKASKYYKENGSLVKQFFSKPGEFNEAVKSFYGSQDKFFKLANFRKGVLEDGLTPFEAMRRANFYLVNYSEVPELVEWLRKSPIGVPFISFTYGVSKPLAKTLLERPDKLANYFKVLNGIQQMNPMGETPQELEKQRDVLPEWMSSGTYLKLPFKDKFNRGQYIDLQYILPFNVVESKSLTPSNPVLTMTSAIVTNKDSFTGKELYSWTDTSEEKAAKVAKFVWQQLAPSWAPMGFTFEKIKAVIQNRPDRYGYIKEWSQVLLDVLGGIKITPTDYSIEAQSRAKEKRGELEDLKFQLRKIMLDKTLFPEERQRERQEVIEKIQKINQ